MPSPASGYVAKLGIGSASPVTTQLSFESADIGLDENFIDSSALTGTRSHDVARTRAATRRVTGGFTAWPTVNEWNALLQWILGAASTGAGTTVSPFVFGLADALISQYVTADKVAKVMTYNGVVVNRATITAEQGGALQLALELVGIDETAGNAGTFPSLTLDVASTYFIMPDLALTANSLVYNVQRVQITIDNHLEDDRWLNSATLTAIPAQDRTIGVDLTLPWGDATALYGLGAAGFPADLKFTNGTPSIDFNFPALVAPRKPIALPGRQEIFWTLGCTAKKSGSNLEMVCNLVTH